jgi:hypothetical protein
MHQFSLLPEGTGLSPRLNFAGAATERTILTTSSAAIQSPGESGILPGTSLPAGNDGIFMSW